MKERPILFSGPMVHALLDGSKTQTRRVVKPQPIEDASFVGGYYVPGPKRTGNSKISVEAPYVHLSCPYGQPGDRLWVRESWQFYDWTEDGQPCVRFAADNASKWPLRIPEEQADRLTEIWAGLSNPENYSIDNHARDRRWRPSIHMPRWASRITLEITSVRVERLQDISDADAQAEGCACYVCGGVMDGLSESDCHCFHKKAKASDYRNLWEQINGPDSWAANPWVWAIEFRRMP